MKKNKTLILLVILLFLQGIFTNIHHPLMPSYVNDLNLPSYMFGFFLAFMNLGIMIAAPIWGSLADKGKKKISVVLGFTIYGVFQYLFGLNNIFGKWSLSIIRFISGFGIAASFAILMSEIIVISSSDKKTRNITFAAAALAIGGALGQFLGGQLFRNEFFIQYFKTDNITNVLLIQGALSVFLAIYTLIFFNPSEKINEEEVKRTSFIDQIKNLKNIDLTLLLFLFALIFFTMAQTNVDKYLDFYFRNNLGYLEDKLGQFKMVVGLVAVFTTVLIVPFLKRVKKRVPLMAFFQVISALLILIIFRGTAFSFLTYLYTFYLIYIVIKTINEPLDREYVSTFADSSNIGVVTGIRQSFYSIGTIIGPILGAFLYEYNSLLVFYISIVFFLIAAVLIIISNFTLKKEVRTNDVE